MGGIVKRLSPVLIGVMILSTLMTLWVGEKNTAAAQGGAARRARIIAFVDLSEVNTRRFFQTTYRALKQSYGNRLEFSIKHVPRPRTSGETIAEAVYCAGDQFRQPDFIDALASGNYTSDKQGMVALAGQLRMNTGTFSECLEKGKKRPFVEADVKEAQKIGLRGVPAFFVQGEYIEGAAGFGAFRSVIDRHLQATTRSPIKIQIVYDKTFKFDDPHKYFSYLNTYFFPDSELSLISHRSPEGQKLMKEVGGRALPTVIFSREVEQTSQFGYFQNELEKHGSVYVLKPEGYTGIVEFIEAPAVGNNPVKGNAKASITITEFSDFECPACGEFVRNTLPKLMEKYIKPGQVKMVFRNYPLTRMHPNAEGAAIAGECAHKAGLFWAYHDKLFENQKALDKASLIKYAEGLGQNGKNFTDCMSAADMRADVQKDLADGSKYGVRSTPTLLINRIRVSGTDAQTVYAILDYLLKKPSAKAEVETSRN